MYRGTTPNLSFHIISDVDLTKIKEVWLTIADFNVEETFKYSAEEVAIDNEAKTISVQLTQEQTLVFEDDSTVEIQMRVLDDSDLSYVTKITEVEMKRILKDGVITDGSD